MSMPNAFGRWLKNQRARSAGRNSSTASARRRRPDLERLEDRLAPATFRWVGDVDTGWATNVAGNTNWFNVTAGTDNGLPAANDDLVFDATGANRATNNNLAAGTVYHSLNFTSNNYQISGNALDLSNGITANVAAANGPVVGVGVTLTANQTFSNAGAQTLQISGSINLNGNTLTVSGTGNTTISGAITGTGGLDKDGSGTLQHTGASKNFNGTTRVLDGVLLLNSAAFDTNISSTIVVGDGVGAAGSAVLRLAVSVEIPNNATITVNSDGLLDLNGHFEDFASLTVNPGGGVATGAANLAVPTITINGTAGNDALVVNATGANSGSFSLNGAPAANFGGVTSFAFNGGNGDDTLTINQPANSFFAPTGGVSFDGQGNGAGGDRLVLNGGFATTITENLNSRHTGTIAFNGTTVITYAGLEPIIDNMNAANRVFNFANPAADITLTRSPLVATQTRIASGVSEFVDFNTPTTSLTVNLANGANAVAVTSFATGYNTPTNTLNGNAGVDTFDIAATPAGTTLNVNTGAGNDVVNVGNAANTVSGILGAINVDGGANDAVPQTTTAVTCTDPAGNATTATLTLPAGDTVNLNDQGFGASSVYTVGAAGLQRAGTALVSYANVETINLNAGTATDLINVTGTPVSSNTTINTDGGGDTVNVGNTGAFSSLVVNGDALSNAIAVTTTGIFGVVVLNAAAGDDVIVVNGSGQFSGLQVNAGDGNDTITAQANALGAGAATVLNGEGDNDTFNINYAATTTLNSCLEVDGGANTVADTNNRDVVNLNANAGGDGARNVGLSYVIAGGLDVTGLGGTANGYALRNVETVHYHGDAADNDRITVTGTAASEDFTSAPVSPSRVLVFNGGDPWQGPAQDPNPFAHFPGIAAGGTAPDLDLGGLATANGLTIDAAGGSNRQFVYATSETSLTVGTLDYFGFGAGVLIPSAAAAGLGSAFDTVNSFGTNDFVQIFNDRLGNNVELVRTNFVAANLQGAGVRLFINTGDEARPAADGHADIANVSPRTDFRVRINGGRPTPPGDVTPPNGDQINVSGILAINVWSDQSFPPKVTIQESNGATQPIDFTDFEDVVLTSPTVNIFGDNNTPGVVQNDEYIITGTGANAFDLVINRSSPIRFFGVNNLNLYGGDSSDVPGGAGDPNSGADRFSIQPFAALPFTTWNIAVRVDGGVEPAGEEDRLAYTGVVGLVDNITLSADTTAPGAGRIYDPNIVLPGAFSPDPGSVAVLFVRTENVNVNANSGDNDHLTIVTTQGNDDVTVRFDPDRTGGKPNGFTSLPTDFREDDIKILNHFDVVIDDGRGVTNPNDGTSILDAPVVDGFKAVTINTLEGNDTVRLNLVAGGTSLADDTAGNPTGGGAGSLPLVNGVPINVTVNAAEPHAGSGDTLVVVGNADLNDDFAVTPGANPQAGTASIGGTDTGTVSFTGVETITLDGGTGAGTDTVTLNGTGAPNSFTLTGTAPLAGDATVDANPTIHFANLGTAGSSVILNGFGGSDEFSVTPIANWGLANVTVNGGDPTGFDTLVVSGTANAADTVVYNPTGVGAGDLVVNALPIIFTSTEHLIYNGLNTTAAADDVTVNGTGGVDEFLVQPGAASDAGTVTVDSFVPLQFRGILGGSVTTGGTAGDILTVDGSDRTDAFVVAANTGAVTVTTDGQGARVPVVPAGISTLRLYGFDGDDTFTVNGPVPAGLTQIDLNGGNPSGDTRDRAILNGDGTAMTFTFGGAGSTVTGGGLGLVNLYTIEEADLNAGAGAITVIGDPTSETLTVQPTGANTAIITSTKASIEVRTNNTGTLTVDGGGGNDIVNVIGTPGNDVIGVARGPITIVTVNALKPVGVVAATTESLVISSGGGVDRVNVTGTGGPANLTIDNGAPNGTGNQSNVLTITNVTAGTTTVQPGPTDDSGVVLTPDGNVNFTNTQSIVLTGAAATDTLVVLGTNGNDTIALQNLGGNNMAWVNNHAVTQFSSFGTVTLNGRFGDDKFNVYPVGLVGVTAINVIGGDSTNGDSVVVNGTAGTDAIAFTPTGPDAGTVAITGAPTVTIATTESLTINGLGGNDALTVNTPAGTTSTTHLTPGATRDSGRVAVDSLLAADFQNIGLTGTVAINDPTAGDGDRLVYDGTAGNDTFTVTGNTIVLSNANGTRVSVSQTNVEALTLNGFDGDDAFTINASALYPGGIDVNGGNPSGSDNVTLNGTAGPDTIALTLAPTGDIVTGVVGGPIVLTSVENLTVNSLAGNDTLSTNNLGGTSDLQTVIFNSGGDAGDTFTATGTPNDDTFLVTPISATSATISANNVVPVVTVNLAAAATSTFTVEGAGDVGDSVTVLGTNNSDFITVDSPNRLVTVENAAGTVYKGITLGATVEQVTADGRLGSDSFLVIPAPATATGSAGTPVGTTAPINLLITINGGTVSQNDSLAIAQAGGAALPASDFVVVNRSRTPDSGVVRVYRNGTALPDISYTNVAIVSPVLLAVVNPAQDPNLLILGPDNYEQNEFLSTASFLGSGSTINVSNLAIFPNAFEHRFVVPDQDFFRVVAQNTGTLDFQVYFRMFAAAGAGSLPGGGNLDLQAFDVAGNRIDNVQPTFGTNDADPNERIRIPVVAGQTYYLRVFGANNLVVNGYNMTIINTAPPTPMNLELQDTPVGDPPPLNSDTGRSQFDNVTRINTPTIFFRLDDGIFLHDLPGNGTNGTPPDQVTVIPFQTALLAGYRIAVFDEGSLPGQTSTPPQTPLGFATAVPGQEGVYQFTTPVLSDGSHFLTARVQIVDPATPTQTGFGPRSAALEIVVDTVPPPVFFGLATVATDGLDPASDSGVIGVPATFTDRITRITTPTFFGTAEANSIVRLFLDLNGNGTVDVGEPLIGQTVALPFDGTNQFPNGRWTVRSNVDFNDPTFFPVRDGTRRVLVTAEDLAGNVSAPQSLAVFIDTQGPQVANVQVTGFPGFNLFGLKPGNLAQGPTPLVNSLTISLTDSPNRDTTLFPTFQAFVATIAATPGIFTVIGDNTGVAAISQVIAVANPPVNGQPATATVQLIFAAPLPDDRFTLRISDTLVDPAGNRLNGESNGIQPGSPNFLSGDSQPGGDFVARFTVDSRPEIGTACCGSVYIDLNGNGVFDPTPVNNDATNADKVFRFGLSGDAIFAGKFAPAGATTQNGFDSLGAYGFANGVYRFLLDFNSDGVADATIVPALQINGLPVAGNFSFAHAGDEVGVFDGSGHWYLDTNGDNNLTAADAVVSDGLTGFPIVGDFDGNGFVDLATYRPDLNTFFFDLNPLGGGPHVLTTLAWGVAGVNERPVAADMNRDGVTDIGLFAPNRAGVTPAGTAEWYFLLSTGTPVAGTINTLNHAFDPAPLGNDLFFRFGDDRSLPVVGNFDPPINVSTLPAPSNLAVVAGALAGSTEHFNGVVSQLYQRYLGRTPDGGGLAFWTNHLQNNTLTEANLEGQLIASDEFFQTHGGSQNAAWLEATYNDLLGRGTDAGGRAYWLGLVNGNVPRSQVATQISSSVERLQGKTQADYQSFLGRAASAGEEAYWVGRMQQGLEEASLLAGLASSPDFFYQPGSPAGSAREWVRQAYPRLLHRAASSADIDFWAGKIQGS